MRELRNQFIVVIAVVLMGTTVMAQPGSIVTQTRTSFVEDVVADEKAEQVLDQAAANQVMNNLVGKWNFEYALSEDLSGFSAGTPVKATVNYRRDFSTGGLFGTAETVTLTDEIISSGTYFIQWNAIKNRLESHGYFVAGETVSIFDEYLEAVVGNTCRWIGQNKEQGVNGSNVLIERTINNGNFNVVVSEISVSGNPLNQLWNVTGIKANPLKEALGPFVALASD